jgi:hypothetical protein
VSDFIEPVEDIPDYLSAEIERHEQEFGVEPIIIGLFWDDPDKIQKNIIDAIEKGKPYNEEEMLDDDDLEAFEEGNLFL